MLSSFMLRLHFHRSCDVKTFAKFMRSIAKYVRFARGFIRRVWDYNVYSTFIVLVSNREVGYMIVSVSSTNLENFDVMMQIACIFDPTDSASNYPLLQSALGFFDELPQSILLRPM